MIETSIIIRTKNEERWISHCLNMILKQNYKKYEIIIVDNNSKDNTLNIIKSFNIKNVIKITKFKPGQALNKGIQVSKGKFIVCLSAHCIPTSNNWLKNLLTCFKTKKIAAAYGRQIPMEHTNFVDKRDLLNVFGLDKKIQKNDYFFHNANSILRRDIWNKIKFDNDVKHLEDRIWAKEIINKRYHIVYEPKACVYHHHGLNHSNDQKRLKGVVNIIEKFQDKYDKNKIPFFNSDFIDISVVIPIKDKLKLNSKNFNQLKVTIKELKKSKYIKKIFTLSDYDYPINSKKVINIKRSNTINDKTDIKNLMQYSLMEIESKNLYPNALMYVNFDYEQRPKNLHDLLIYELLQKGLDTVFPALEEYGDYWFLNKQNNFRNTSTHMISREYKNPTYKALYGLGCLTYSNYIRSGKFAEGKIGIVPIKNIKFSKRSR